MKTVEEQLESQAQLVGRPVKYRGAWECTFHGQDGCERTLRVLVYDLEPHDVAGITMSDSRWIVWDGKSTTGGIVE